jgi:hypothetical protein
MESAEAAIVSPQVMAHADDIVTLSPFWNPPSADQQRHLANHLRTALNSLEAVLDTRKKSQHLFFGGGAAFPGIAPMLVRRAEDLTRRVWAAGGAGSIFTEHALIKTVAAAADPGSLPFLHECLERNVPREKTGPERRTLAVLAIALIAREGSTEAKQELRQHLGAANVDQRTNAVDAAIRAFGENLPDDLRADLEPIARSDPAFAPRFLARGAMVALGAKPIVDVPKGSYVFTSVLRGTKNVSRTVELRSTHSLDVLAGAVLSAYRWDHDHIYAFYFDERDRGGPFTLGTDQGREGPEAESETVGMGAPIGAHGLVKGQRFAFHYDFGDNHFFDVTVDAIVELVSARVKLPRVVAQKGRSPEQYRNW